MVESSKTRRRDASLEKEENAAKKMKMTDTSGVGEKLLQGEVPSTKEIKQVIDQAKESLGDQGLTNQGKRLASDIKDVLDSSKLLLDKNKGEKLQNFLKYASDFSEEVATRGQKLGEKTSDEQYQAMKEASDLAQNIRGAVVFSLQSGDFRQLLGDYVELMQNIAGMFRDAAKSGDMQKAKKAVEKASLSDEQKKDLKNRFAELMKRVSQNKEFNKAFNNLFSIFDALQSTFMKAKKEAKKPFESESFDNMMSEVDGLIIEFCGKDDWNRFKKDFWALLESIQNDKPAAEFFEDLRFHLRASLENPYDVTSGPMMRRGQELLDKAFKLMDTGKDKYRGKFRSLFDDMQSLLDNLANDKALTSIGESLGKLSQDLFTDSQGKPDVYVAQESISQLKQIFLPAIREKLENIPLPRIEGSNDTYDYYVENMLFNGSDILPDAFHIQVLNDVKMDSNEPARDKMMTQVDLSISNIRLEFKNMNFFYRRKVIPKIEDYGTANVEIGGEGLKLKMSWKLVSKSDEPIKMDLADVTCNIDELNIQILDAKHSIIDGIISNMFPGYIKDVLTQSIVDKIKETVAPFNDQMNEFFRKQREIYNQKMDELGEKLKEKIQ